MRVFQCLMVNSPRQTQKKKPPSDYTSAFFFFEPFVFFIVISVVNFSPLHEPSSIPAPAS
jgi:hypothetical protein